jgi:hypothetical protein
MKTISILADIIIPKDGTSGSATDAKVPDFIEFIVKDMPRHQTTHARWIEVVRYSMFETFQCRFCKL